MSSLCRLVATLVVVHPLFAAAQAPSARVSARARPVVHALPGITMIQNGPGTPAVTIVEFSDFECPFCATLAPLLKQLLDEYPGQIRVVFKHNPLPMHVNAPLAHEAALAAGVQGRFWEMHDVLFANQRRLSRYDLIGYARQLHLDIPEFTAALTDHRFKAIVEQDLIEGRGLGVEATPTFFINGLRRVGAPSYAELKAAMEEALGGPASRTVNAEDNEVAHIDVTGAAAKGAADAAVTIVEFSDLQCPYCAQALPTVQQLMAAYPGKIRWVFKHYPLSIHPNAMIAHQAAVAAAEQDQFWPMHDALFANQQAVKRDDLVATAQRLKLDAARFLKDLDDGSLRAKIDGDLKQGAALGVSGTPTFYINGRRLVGARPLADFKAIIEEELAAGAAPGTAPPPSIAREVPSATGEVAARETKGAPGAARAEPDVSRGEHDAPVTLLWFSDFRSGLTSKAANLVRQVTDAYPGRVRVVVRHRPLETRPESQLAHEAAVAAAAQGKFWPMHDAIVAAPAGVLDRDRLIKLAEGVGLDGARFVADLDSGAYRSNVERDIEDARRRDIRGTPVFFVNGQRIDGIQPLEVFSRAIDDELRRSAQK